MLASRNGALLFAGITLFGVVVLVGEEGSGGVLQETTEQFTQQQGQMERDVRDLERAPPSEPIILPYRAPPPADSDTLGPPNNVNGQPFGNVSPDTAIARDIERRIQGEQSPGRSGSISGPDSFDAFGAPSSQPIDNGPKAILNDTVPEPEIR